MVSRVDLNGAVLCAPAAMDLIEDKKAIQRGEKLVQILSKLIADMEKQYGASAEEIDKDRKKYGYHSPLDEVAEVRCPILIVNGLADDNSPPSIIDIYVKKLRAAGKQVDSLLRRRCRTVSISAVPRVRRSGINAAGDCFSKTAVPTGAIEFTKVALLSQPIRQQTGGMSRVHGLNKEQVEDADILRVFERQEKNYGGVLENHAVLARLAGHLSRFSGHVGRAGGNRPAGNHVWLAC